MIKFVELQPIEKKDTEEAPESEPLDWAIVAVNAKGNAYLMDAASGFSAYDYWQEDDMAQHGCPVELPEGMTEDAAGVYRVTGLRCIDSGISDTENGREYDTPTFGGGEWEKILDIDAALPIVHHDIDADAAVLKEGKSYRITRDYMPYVRKHGYVTMLETDFNELREHAAGQFQNVLQTAVDRMGWPEIQAFEHELRKGQDVREDAGGYFMRALGALLGIKHGNNEVKNYKQAALAMIAEAQKENK